MKVVLTPKNWKNELVQYDITYLTESKKIIELCKNKRVLPCTSCSKTKGQGGDREIPENFYISNRNLRFYDWCRKLNLKYGILSDLYGLHYHDELKKFYDIHPSALNLETLKLLGKKIGVKAKDRNYTTLLFWNSSPLMSRPYFTMMLYSKLKVYFITKLYTKARNQFNIEV